MFLITEECFLVWLQPSVSVCLSVCLFCFLTFFFLSFSLSFCLFVSVFLCLILRCILFLSFFAAFDYLSSERQWWRREKSSGWNRKENTCARYRKDWSCHVIHHAAPLFFLTPTFEIEHECETCWGQKHLIFCQVNCVIWFYGINSKFGCVYGCYITSLSSVAASPCLRWLVPLLSVLVPSK